MNVYIIFGLVTSVVAILYGLYLASRILKLPQGEEKMIEISKAIQEGAKAYLNRQYKTVL
ncbi:MAG: sodium/proton-translocating pyrophosphatase, partial [bacterium]|nr:sodium/proton-translocating pyrophosphatase [bacterium]